MAVEIKEIVIRAIISDTDPSETTANQEVSGVSKDALVQQCVDQVLKVLKKKNRR